MWFTSALVYRYELDQPSDVNTLLAADALKPCPPHARFIYGWTAPHASALALEVAGSTLFSLGKEERILPKSVIKRILAERALAFEAQHGRSMKRADKAQLAEELEFDLLPKAFCIQKRTLALLDTVKQHLIINSSSKTQASQLIAQLRKSIPGIQVEPLSIEANLPLQFVQWINQPETLPQHFQLASDCLLFSLDDEKKRFACKGYELPADEVLTLLSQGLAPSEISLIWNERIQFTFTQDATIKRLKCLDYLVDEFQELRKLDDEDQQMDAAITLLSGELRLLIGDLLKAVQSKPEVEKSVVALCH